jgi:hypothetical protein
METRKILDITKGEIQFDAQQAGATAIKGLKQLFAKTTCNQFLSLNQSREDMPSVAEVSGLGTSLLHPKPKSGLMRR